MKCYGINIDYLVDCYDGAKKDVRTGTRTKSRKIMEKDISDITGYSMSFINHRNGYWNLKSLATKIINNKHLLSSKIEINFNDLVFEFDK